MGVQTNATIDVHIDLLIPQEGVSDFSTLFSQVSRRGCATLGLAPSHLVNSILGSSLVGLVYSIVPHDMVVFCGLPRGKQI